MTDLCLDLSYMLSCSNRILILSIHLLCNAHKITKKSVAINLFTIPSLLDIQQCLNGRLMWPSEEECTLQLLYD